MSLWEPSETPLFPLRSVLFPEGYLPLRIFEPRYLDMVQRCHAAGRPFGVLALTEGREVRAAGQGAEAFEAVGTLARIDSLSRVQPGLFYLQARGTERFRVKHARCLSHGLWVGQTEALPPDTAIPVPEDLHPAADQLRALLASWSTQVSPAELPFQEPHRWDDAGWLANRWAELLPLTATERQRLMLLDSPLLRLELVIDRLDSLGPLPV
jgi:uncharacterized protein